MGHNVLILLLLQTFEKFFGIPQVFSNILGRSVEECPIHTLVIWFPEYSNLHWGKRKKKKTSGQIAT